ncbi:MAG TPA: glycoside hydrolase family 15 protein [Solirubrobacteraceae bacterium]|nr:glycoside hydrolase family 15 protein [Solirubrobacteraceae bacterium]
MLGRTSLAVAGALLCAAGTAQAAPPAPGAPGDTATWAPADKHGFATAHATTGNAYLTLRQASMSEVYFPDLSTPAFRGLQFAVVDGGTATRETVDDDPRHIEPVADGVTATVTPLPGALGFRQVTETTRWRLTKTWITDPARATVLARVKFESLAGKKLKLYVLADPAPGDDGDDDRGSGLVAWDDDAATAVAAVPRLKGATSGYRGTASDPWRRLEDRGKLRRYAARKPGNVYQGARTSLDGVRKQAMTLAIGFGAERTAAERRARRSLAAGFGRKLARFTQGWTEYVASLAEPPAAVAADPALRAVYDQSLMVLAASEDKRFRGASIASPSMPWEWGVTALDDKPESGPYHLVWPRDFYHVATAQKAAGDDAAATRLLDYLWEVQKADGSWWQNTRVNGQEYWTTLQMDETALPVVLAWWLGRTSAEDWRHVQRAADFIVAKGPQTDQERWENQSGWSPNTIAAEIAGLICAADIARKHGATGKAATYEQVADAWEAQVESWTATNTGPYSPKPYYLRVTKPVAEGAGPDPDAGTTYDLGDNRPEPVDQREIVDNSFLGLALFGVKKWNDQTILNSLAVGESLGVDTPSGRIYHRFTFDGYGETSDGGDWTIFDEKLGQTHGRLWPLLTGERGEYELLAGRPATAQLQTIANTANDGLMLPEQVWDEGPEAGENTRSATPLAWTHAQFVRLAWSIAAGTPIERPAIVACRYTGEAC